MVRAVLIAPLVLAGVGACTPDPAANADVDIGNAASAAQGTVNAYGESLAAERTRRRKQAFVAPSAPAASASGTSDGRMPVAEAPIALGLRMPERLPRPPSWNWPSISPPAA